MLATFLLLVLLSISDLVNAIPWDGPRPTKNDQLGADWSPAPTGAFTSPLELFRRAGQYPLTVCGFIGGDLTIPATCSSGSSCVWFNDLSAVGCCTTSGSQCTYPTACLDGGSPPRTPDANDPLTMTCPNSQGARECYTNQFPDDYTEVGCGYRSWATTVETKGAPDVSIVVTYKPANHNPSTFRPSGNPAPAPSPSPASSGPSSGPSSTAPSSPQSSTPSNPSSSPPSGPSSGSSPSPSSGPSSGPSGISIAAVSTNGGSGSSNSVSSGSTTDDPTASTAGTGSSNAETTSTPGGTGGTAPAGAQAKSSGPNVGAIAGGAAGGGVALLVIAALIWWLLRRRRRRRGNASAQAALANEKAAGHQGPAELPSTYASPAPTYTSELDGTSPRASQRLSELDGRRIYYQPYRPPQPAVELPTTRM